MTSYSYRSRSLGMTITHAFSNLRYYIYNVYISMSSQFVSPLSCHLPPRNTKPTPPAHALAASKNLFYRQKTLAAEQPEHLRIRAPRGGATASPKKFLVYFPEKREITPRIHSTSVKRTLTPANKQHFHAAPYGVSPDIRFSYSCLPQPTPNPNIAKTTTKGNDNSRSE